MNARIWARRAAAPLLVVALSQLLIWLLVQVSSPLSGQATRLVLHGSMMSLVVGGWILWRAFRSASALSVEDRAYSARSQLLLPAAVVVLGLGLTTLAVYRTFVHSREMAHIRFDQLTDRVVAETERRVNQIVYGLHGARGVFKASQSVSRAEFVDYVRSCDLQSEFPGALGMGLIRRVFRADLDAFIARERADGAPGFEVSTVGDAPDLYVITVIEPMDKNRQAWGFDIGSEAVRREAVEWAVRNGAPTLTGRVTLLQDERRLPGFLYLVPVYRNDTVPSTPSEREAALEGIVYSPLVIDDVLEPIMRAAESLLEVDVFDGSRHDESALLYHFGEPTEDGGVAAAIAGEEEPMFAIEKPLSVGGRTWMVSMRTLPTFDSGVERGLPAAVGVGGAILSLLTGGVVWSLATGRARARSLAMQMTRDLAAAKGRAEDALRQFDALIYTLNQHAIVSVADRSGRIVDINDAFCEISGYTREDLLGQDHRIINSGQHPKSFWVDMWRTVAAGNPWRADVCNRAKDGSLYWVDSIIAPFRGADGRIEKIVSIRNDITERKRVQSEILEKNREMEQFVYTASHDLKSPIVTILGYIRHLLQDLEAGKHEELPDYAMRIRRAAERMRTSVDDLLDFSRVGRVALTAEEIDLRAFVEELVEALAPRFEERGARVRTDVRVPSLRFDRSHLTHLLQNLLENAAQYGCAGPDPRIEVIAEPGPGESVELRVRDHGEGIPLQHRERVFGLFQRLSSDKSGTGVGLSIVRRIAQRNGGSATIEDTPGGGTTVRVRLVPLSPLPQQESNPGESHATEDQRRDHALSAG